MYLLYAEQANNWDFVDLSAHKMPRTALRYAIKKMSEQVRQYWLQKK